MKVAIIADDLTGANDTGVQFAKKGLLTSVLMKEEVKIKSDLDVLIIDTDSRSQPANEAYARVRKVAKLLDRNMFDIIYKKIDSTMRGNIGAELDAIYDILTPDVIILAPGYPLNHRKVKKGCLYIGNKLLHETDFAKDPKNPMSDSYIPNILSVGTERSIALITCDEISKGSNYVQERIQLLKEKNPYILFDTCTDDDLKIIVESVKMTNLNVIWSGSAGLADHLIDDTLSKRSYYKIPKNRESVFMVVGSVNENSRKQLKYLLTSPSVKGIELRSQYAVKDEEKVNSEIHRVLKLIDQALKDEFHVVLYSAGNPDDIVLANECGKKYDLTPQMVSDRISELLGRITANSVTKYNLKRLFLTGGDTAKSVCNSLDISEFRLFDEIEMGVPIGMLVDENEIITITKAGGFGSKEVLLRSLEVLGGEELSCVQSLE